MKKDVPNNSKKIEDYIELAPENQKVILQKIRKLLLNSKFNLVEDWKWGPNYSFNGMICGYAYFKNHIKINFFNGAYLSDKHRLFNYGLDNEHNRGINIQLNGTLNWKQLESYILESCSYNLKHNTKNQSIIRPTKKIEFEIPVIISEFLNDHPTELSYLKSLANSHQKEYVSWITDAKKEETQLRRLHKMLFMLQEKKKLSS